jgi:hydroxyethylthiazole kinase-like uncharacterized protein yjeF
MDSMIKIVSVEQMQAIERATDAAGTSYDEMMQHAGRAVAEAIKSLLGDETATKRVAVLVGPGNNGGDGLVAARILKEETKAEIGCYLLKPRSEDDQVFTAARDAEVALTLAEDDQRWRVLKKLVGNADILVDALLGTGARLPIRDNLKKLLDYTSNALHRSQGGETGAPLIWPRSPHPGTLQKTIVVAVDCPSGLDCDTGELDKSAIPADYTVTFAGAKTGQFIFPGAAAIGELIVADIHTPPDLPEVEAITTELATGQGIKALLPARPLDGHKGTFGRAVIIGGSVNYTGAAALSGEAAYRVGAGLVTMAVPQAIYPILAAQLRETTWLLLPHTMGVINDAAINILLTEVGEAEAWLIGPGISHEEETAAFLRGLLKADHRPKKGNIGFGRTDLSEPDNGQTPDFPPLVIDADGLNLLAEIDAWWELLPPGTILTPHPGEMARLAGLDAPPHQHERLGLAIEKAAEWGCVVVLKGAFTVIAEQEGKAIVLPFATDALATAGSGDVLAGCIVGMLAQGLNPFEAAVSGPYVHALAGEIAARKQGSSRSVIAGDVLHTIPAALAQIEAI